MWLELLYNLSITKERGVGIKQERIDIPDELYSKIMLFAEDRLNYLMEGYYEPEEGDRFEDWKLTIFEKIEEFYDDIKLLLYDYWIN